LAQHGDRISTHQNHPPGNATEGEVYRCDYVVEQVRKDLQDRKSGRDGESRLCRLGFGLA